MRGDSHQTNSSSPALHLTSGGKALHPHIMVLTQPPNQHVTKAFDLTGKVAVVTGM